MNGDPNITKKAEIEAIQQLRNSGWNITRWDPEAEGAKDIEATAGGRRILVQVKTAVAPNAPPPLTPPEKETFRARAQNQRANGYQARVMLDQQLNRVGEIGWTRVI